MIKDVINNLDELHKVLKQEQLDTQATIQTNARNVLSEIMDVVGVHYDVNSIDIKTVDWTNKKGIYIENNDNSYYGLNATFNQNTNSKEWTSVDFGSRISGDINSKQIIRSIEFSQLVLAISTKMITNQELIGGLFNKMHKHFNVNDLLNAKMTVIQHFKHHTTTVLDLVKLEEVWDKGHLKLDNGGRYVQSFGNDEKYCDEIKFTKNSSGTYTAEMLYDGTKVSQSTRASSALLSRIVRSMMDITSFIEF